MNSLYGWKGRVHKAIKVFELCKIEYVRVYALPKTKNAMMKTINRTTCNHDADIALTWILLESSRRIVDVTCDGYIASIRRSFDNYRRIQAENALSQQIAASGRAPIPNNNNETTDPTITLWIEGVVENTINSHVKFIEQWRDIISDAQKEASGWKREHKKYLNKMSKVEKAQKRAQDPNYDSDDDSVASDDSDSDNSDGDSSDESEIGDDDENDDMDDHDSDDSINEHGDNRLELLRMGIRVDEHADRVFQIGTYVAAGKVLISSLKIASKIDSIETAAQEAGTASILGLAQANLSVAEVRLGGSHHTLATENNAVDARTADCKKSENDIVEEWKEQADTSKVNAIYSWYRLYHGALPCVKIEKI